MNSNKIIASVAIVISIISLLVQAYALTRIINTHNRPICNIEVSDENCY